MTGSISVCFTPAEQCESRIVGEIDKAKSTIRVQAYGFTSFPMIQALQRAAGIPVWIDFEPPIAHNKVIVTDDYLTIG